VKTVRNPFEAHRIILWRRQGERSRAD